MLADALDDLCAQNHPKDRYEIIVVDDGSSDDTPQVVDRAIRRKGAPLVTYVPQPHLGLNPARNAGAEVARGELLAYLDDDVAVAPAWVTAVIGGAARHPEAGCFAGRITLRFEGSPPRSCGRHPLGETELEMGDEDRVAPQAWGANMILRRSAFDEIGPFDPSLNHCGDEIEWQHRLKRSGGHIVYLPEAVVVHRRPAADLRLRKMLRGRYRKGKAWPRLAKSMDRPMSAFGGLRHVAIGILHALTRLCAGGLLQAAFGLGHFVSGTRMAVMREDKNVTLMPARWRKTH